MKIFSDRLARRVIDATEQSEGYWKNARRLGRADSRAGGVEPYIARVTNGTPDAQGYYQAVITAIDPAILAPTYVDYAAVYLLPANGETLVNATRYGCRPVVGDYNATGLPAYQVLQGVDTSGGGTTFVGARVTKTAANTIASGGAFTAFTGFSADYDSSTFAVTGGLTVPTGSPGKYSIKAELDVGSVPTFAYVAQFQILLNGTAIAFAYVSAPANSAYHPILVATTDYLLANGDSLQVAVAQTNGSAGNVQFNPCSLSAHLIH